jgi:uncharacterized protein
MTDFATTTLALFALIALVYSVRAGTPRDERTRGLMLIGIALLCTIANGLVVLGGLEVSRQLPVMSGLGFNWIGKALAVVATLLMMRAVRGASPAEFGLTLRQREGSIGPAILATVALCAFSWTIQAVFSGGSSVTAERLLYQATMPGLDEELFFRGLLLAILFPAFRDRWNAAGARIGGAGLAVTFLFAAGHGLRISGGTLHFSALVFAVVGVLGFGFLWLRQRSDSLVFPVLAHNLVNVGNTFF